MQMYAHTYTLTKIFKYKYIQLLKYKSCTNLRYNYINSASATTAGHKYKCLNPQFFWFLFSRIRVNMEICRLNRTIHSEHRNVGTTERTGRFTE